MSDIKILFGAAALSVLALLAGCSAKKTSSGESDEIPTETIIIEEEIQTTEAVTVLTVTKASETTAASATKVEVSSIPTTETATEYVAATDNYKTFEAAGLGNEAGKTHSSKPVTLGDLFVSVADVGVMPEYELVWTGTNPWSVINIVDSNGVYYTYNRDGGNNKVVNQATGDEYDFDVITTGSTIDGFAIYDMPQADYYTVTVTGSATIAGWDSPCDWNGFLTYVYPN